MLVHFIKLIFFAIIFEFLSCFGVNTDPEPQAQDQISADTLTLIVPDTAYTYRVDLGKNEDI